MTAFVKYRTDTGEILARLNMPPHLVALQPLGPGEAIMPVDEEVGVDDLSHRVDPATGKLVEDRRPPNPSRHHFLAEVPAERVIIALLDAERGDRAALDELLVEYEAFRRGDER